MQDYKIRIPNGDISRQVQEKAFELGHIWASHSTEILVTPGLDWIILYQNGTIQCRTNRQMQTSTTGVQHYPEISHQDFLRLGESITTNTTTEIMSEITLKCITAPQKAKNITVDRDYTGILTDSEDTQVDTLGEAKFFRCVNNNGVEAKYRLSLFAPIIPPAPPRPAKITQEDLIKNIEVSRNTITSMFNGNIVDILSFGYSDLITGYINCSCGIKSVKGLDSLYERIMEELEGDDLSNMISDYNRTTFAYVLFKQIVNAKINSIGLALCLFSTVEDSEVVCELMDEITEENGGVSSNFFLNPNSGNNIKAWLIPRL